MAQKGLESLIRELQKTVVCLSQKVDSLETKVSEQNALITSQLKVITQLKCYTKTLPNIVQSSPDVSGNKALQRPVRQARLKTRVEETAVTRSNATAGSTRRTSIVESYASVAIQPAGSQTKPTPASSAHHPNQISTASSTEVKKVEDLETVIDGDWQKVSKPSRKNRQRAVIRGSGAFDCDLQTVERVKKIHACYFKPDTSEEALKSYMEKKNPCNGYEVKKLTLKHNYYASFMIIVPNSKIEYFMSAANWPARTEVSEWFRRGAGRAVRPLKERALRGPADPETDIGVEE
ncbi:jg790 [Pararge aegeria aegeria]|uniref:Jg790 protein n=1 Tax=Pararge aegeria aegeria TaxID=348720 RepID=A0A8S4QFF8_9NEOP|nr:jg790 [Pararge aegeria aegeria]